MSKEFDVKLSDVIVKIAKLFPEIQPNIVGNRCEGQLDIQGATRRYVIEIVNGRNQSHSEFTMCVDGDPNQMLRATLDKGGSFRVWNIPGITGISTDSTLAREVMNRLVRFVYFQVAQ